MVDWAYHYSDSMEPEWLRNIRQSELKIRSQALESFCLVYYLATLLICTECMVMAVYGEVGKMWLDITVTFTILSQQLFGGPVENHEKCQTSQFLGWEMKSGSRRNTTTISQEGNDDRVAAPLGSCLRVAPTKSWPATPTLGGSVSCCTRLSISTLYQLKLKRRTSVWLCMCIETSVEKNVL